MTVAEFIVKWKKVRLKESSASQEHFNDLCALLAHPTPATADPTGSDFCFEKGATKLAGGEGWADVWKRGHFAWEYKGRYADLDKAYAQLQKYRESLENPPLLVVSDMDRILIRTNFTNTPTVTHVLSLDTLVEEEALRDLRALFFDPDKLKPKKTTQAITELAASRITDLAQALDKRGIPPQKVARFLDRIVFCLFAQDVGLLPKGLFKALINNAYEDPSAFSTKLRALFQVMATGGEFGVDTIKHFNGDLFADVEVIDLTDQDLLQIRTVANDNWSAIDASIFGTLFERAMDPNKRGQLGAHYTNRQDIETVVDPVVMAPLEREWAAVQEKVDQLVGTGNTQAHNKARGAIRAFTEHLHHVTILDPACGSGNFLYVALQRLKNLEKRVILYSIERGLPPFLPNVGPWQLHGIEVSPYAHELAQMTVWIGWLQWIQANGFGEAHEPILQKLDTFQCRDAVIESDEHGVVKEPEWPEADFIIGNPPFLGGKKMRKELGDEYVDNLFRLWKNRVPAEADFCCYWFEKARKHIEDGKCQRAGLLATQGIRGGANRRVLDRIKETGNIFFAVSDRNWVNEGAMVHVSMLGFDNGKERQRVLDGKLVEIINSDLTATADVTKATKIPSNLDISFMGDTKGGAFDVDEAQVLAWLHSPNPHGRPNSDVLRPWVNGKDVSQFSRRKWIIDFPIDATLEDAARYEVVYEHLKSAQAPTLKEKRAKYTLRWWLHTRPRPEMRKRIAPLSRFLVTITTGKHRLYAWLTAPTLPDHALIVFAREDDYFLGIVQSRVHRVWSLGKGTQLREKESGFRYTPTSTFETFPFPAPSDELRNAVIDAARKLNEERNTWLHPKTLVMQHTLTFPASPDGPWGHMIAGDVKDGIGSASYTRTVAMDPTSLQSLKKRTLTRLYSQNPDWLRNAHRSLDEAVLAAYGLPPDTSDSRIVELLLAMNFEQSKG